MGGVVSGAIICLWGLKIQIRYPVRQTSHLPDAVFEENRIGAGSDAQLFQQPVK
jgi:hypothetical protein